MRKSWEISACGSAANAQRVVIALFGDQNPPQGVTSRRASRFISASGPRIWASMSFELGFWGKDKRSSAPLYRWIGRRA
jgi:hypothetical protein